MRTVFLKILTECLEYLVKIRIGGVVGQLKPSSLRRHQRLKLSVTEELPDEQYIICPPTIQAYILKERLWGQCSIFLWSLPNYRSKFFSPGSSLDPTCTCNGIFLRMVTTV